MRAELENVARASDGDCVRLGRERPVLEDFPLSPRTIWSISSGAKPEISIGASVRIKLLELDLELFEIPLPFLGQAIDRKAQHTLLVLAQMIDAHARDTAKAKEPRRLDPDRRRR